LSCRIRRKHPVDLFSGPPPVMLLQLGDAAPPATMLSWERGGERMAKGGERGDIPREWLEEFEAAARRALGTRMPYGFLHPYKPVLDGAPYRAFDTMEQYRRWCEENLPDWLGYGRV